MGDDEEGSVSAEPGDELLPIPGRELVEHAVEDQQRGARREGAGQREAERPEAGHGRARGHELGLEALREVTHLRGEADVGEDCEAPNDCAAGLTCSGFFEQACVRICALEVEGSCPADEGTCVAYAQSPEGTGLCTLDATMMR